MPKRLKVTLTVILISFFLSIYFVNRSETFFVYVLIFLISFCYAIIIIFKMVIFKGYYSEESIKKRKELKLLKKQENLKRKQEGAKQKQEFKKLKEEKKKEEKRRKEENKQKWLEQKAKEKAERERIKMERKAQEQKKINEVWSDISEIPQFPEKTLNFLKKNYSLKEIQGMLGRGEKIQGIGSGMSDAILRVMRNKSF